MSTRIDLNKLVDDKKNQSPGHIVAHSQAGPMYKKNTGKMWRYATWGSQSYGTFAHVKVLAKSGIPREGNRNMLDRFLSIQAVLNQSVRCRV